MAVTAAVGRVLTFIFVICQSYFKWSSDDQVTNSDTYFTQNQHLAGLILARGGSKGIPNKNMANLYGKPLIYWSLKAMVDSGVFTTIWISTDNANITEWVENEFRNVRGVQVHSRASYTATDTATSIIAVQEFLSFHPEVDAIGLVQVTSPFVQATYLNQAYILLSKYDSVFSAYRSKKLRWKSVESNSQKETTHPLNFDPKHRPRRQEWDGEMVENGMFYFTMRDVLMNDNVFQGTRSTYVEVHQFHSLEIDTPRDLELAELLMKNPHLLLTDASTKEELKSKSEL